MFAQLLEARGFDVKRRLGLGATELAFRALSTGAIDVYPEYTGTGLLAILGERGSELRDPAAVFSHIQTQFKQRYGMRWLPPLGFQNTYAMAVRRETAESLGLKSLSDLQSSAAHLRAGFTPDFIGRPDGWPGLSRAYDLKLQAIRSLVPSVKYRALAAGEVDIIDGYSTDGLIARYDLAVLCDDRNFFPPYEAAALVGRELQRDLPAAIATLTELSGRLDAPRMRELNRRVEDAGETIERVASDALNELALTGTDRSLVMARESNRGSVTSYLRDQRRTIAALTARHLLLVAVSLVAAILVAVPLGLALERTRKTAETVIRGVGVLQTLPSMALLAFMIPLLGIGVVPALAALFLYSLYPIVRNTYTGVRDADPQAVAAAIALGMTPMGILWQVRLPLAAPIIMAGIRTAGVINVGTATLAALIGAGGLGDPIVAGLALSDTRMVLSGAIPAALLALAVDAALGLCERLVRPEGILSPES